MVVRTRTGKSSKDAITAVLTDQPATQPVAIGEGEQTASGVQRGAPEISEETRKYVTGWHEEIRSDKTFFKDDYKRMREDMEYARLGANKEWVSNDNYTVPLINRHINQEVAALYAKSPKAVAKRKKRLMYKLWDGTEASAKAALTLYQAGDQMGAAIVKEIQDVTTYNQMIDRLGSTLEIMFEHYTGEDYPDFKIRMKQNVRRAKTCGVGYVELNFHRKTDLDPDITSRLGDMSSKLATLESNMADITDDKIAADDPEIEETRNMIADLKEQPEILVDEGLIFDFPRSTEIIPHRACQQLQGFIGCDYITREFHMTPAEIQEIYKIDITGNFKMYYERQVNAPTGGSDEEKNDEVRYDAYVRKGDKKSNAKACVWRIYNKKTRQIFTLCEGYPDYLKKPAQPEVDVPGFWNVFSLIFNPAEDERKVFPLSDVHYLKHPQREFNSTRESLREHRKANRPKYFTRAGALEEYEGKTIENAPAHSVIPLKGLDPKTKIEELIQPWKGVTIDPNLYETGSIVKDILFGVGSQSANLGPTTSSTATESSIAESSRKSTQDSNVDDLDEHLTEIARAAGQIMLAEIDPQTVTEIVGPGAVWPELDRETIAKEVFLAIKAGSSGRPNKAAELANLERGMPFIIQLGGVNPAPLSKHYMDLLDISSDDTIIEGMPSIITINAIAAEQAKAQFAAQNGAAPAAGGGAPQASTGNPATDPSQQGGQGAANAPQAPGTAPGGQPGFPTPTRRYDASGKRVQ